MLLQRFSISGGLSGEGLKFPSFISSMTCAAKVGSILDFHIEEARDVSHDCPEWRIHRLRRDSVTSSFSTVSQSRSFGATLSTFSVFYISWIDGWSFGTWIVDPIVSLKCFKL